MGPTDRQADHKLDLYHWLQQLFGIGAKMANFSLKIVKLAWLLSATCLLGGVAYLIGIRDYHWGWCLPYGLITALPVVVLGYYHWMLTSLTQAPEQLSNLKELITRFSHDHPEETRAVLAHKIAAIGKWKTYRLIGQVIKDIIAGADDASSFAGNMKTLSAMANPVFWFALILSLLVSLVFSSLLFVGILTHAVLG